MSPILVGLIVFVGVFGAALAGMALREKLPPHHSDADSRDVVKLVMSLIATIAALVLSLLIATAHTSYETQVSEVQTLGLHLTQIDQSLAQYGQEADETRRLLRQIVAAEVEQIWPSEGSATVNLRAPIGREPGMLLAQLIANLTPNTETQRFLKSRALQLLTAMSETRGLLYEQAGGSLAWPFFVVLIFWLVVIFLGFGYLGRPNATVVVALFVGSLSVAGAIFLILEMDRPYSGLMRISNAPVRDALGPISP